MNDKLATGAAWLARKMRSHAAREITYTRGASNADIPATLGRSFHNVDDAGGLGGLLRVETRDYLIAVAVLELDGIPAEPKAGDRITDGDYVYEVSSPGQGIDHYTVDPHRTMFRVHVKLVTDNTTP